MPFRFNIINQFRLTSAIIFSLVSLIILESCGTNPAFAAEVAIRYRNPGSTRPYDAIEVCTTAGCERLVQACAPNAQCSVMANFERGASYSVWLVGSSLTERSQNSNIRVVDVPSPSGCRWDINADGVVGATDLLGFIRGFDSGAYNTADFTAFKDAFGSVCPRP